MIWMIAPAKTMNTDKKISVDTYTMPYFLDEAGKLIEELKKYDPTELSKLMGISDKLSELNVLRYNKWESVHNRFNSKPSIAYYDGEVYKSMDSESFDIDELKFMQQHLRIISGLYGVLRPFDIIQPYRLEMGIKLKNETGSDLYDFWMEKITGYLNHEIENQGDNVLINLASKEYSKAVDTQNFKGIIIDIVFKEYRNGKYKVIPFNSKRARGFMVKYLTENHIDNIEEIKEFDDGYKYCEELSQNEKLVFIK